METNLAVLIDFENIAAGTEKEGLGRFDVEALMQRVKDKGRILVARSYADWGRFSRFKQALLTSNVTMMELTSHGMQDKNRADIAMVVDALELAFTRPYIDTFVVVSGDSDFTPMVLKMRELNKRVIGCGTRKSTSRLLVQACDEFFFYDTIAQPKKAARHRATAPAPKQMEPGRMTLDTAYDLLEQALEGLQREDPDPPLASIVKTAVLRKSPDFSETDLGFGSFARFLESAQDAGVVKVIRDNKSGGYRVTPLDSVEPDELAEPEETERGAWRDPYLPAGSRLFLEPLAEAGLNPLAAPTRKAVLEAIVDSVNERKKRRRKSTIPFVAEDVQKALRRTHPDLPMSLVKSLLEAMLRAGLLIHRDGTSIRSANATFKLDKDADEINRALTSYFLAILAEAGVDMSDTGLLAELMHGDASRRREIEETLAWLLTQSSSPEDEASLNEVDLDDLLLMDAPAKAEPAPAPAARKPAAARAPSSARSAEKAPSEKVTEVADDNEDESDDDKPKKRRKRSRGKKKGAGESESEAEGASEPADDLDALLEPSDG